MPLSIGPAELVIVLIIFGIVVLPLVAVVLVLRSANGTPTEPVPWTQVAAQPAASDPRVVLADRLARGEISREEFDTAMRALGYTDHTG